MFRGVSWLSKHLFKKVILSTSLYPCEGPAQGCPENVSNQVSGHNVLQRLLSDIASIRLCFIQHLWERVDFDNHQLNQLCISLTLGRCGGEDITVIASLSPWTCQHTGLRREAFALPYLVILKFVDICILFVAKFTRKHHSFVFNILHITSHFPPHFTTCPSLHLVLGHTFSPFPSSPLLLNLPAVSHPLRGEARLCVTSLEWVKLSFLALIKALISMVHNNIHSLMSMFLDPIFSLYSRAGKHFMIDMVAISIGWVRSAAMCC